MSNIEHGLSFIDIMVFAIYVAIIIGVGLWVSRDKKGTQKSTEDYFLAGKSLPWWAVGASLIAANISAEQFIGMSGSGYSIGLAIASYEWMSAITLIIVGKYFLPIFIEKGIYTIPEFVEKRFNKKLKTILAVFLDFLVHFCKPNFSTVFRWFGSRNHFGYSVDVLNSRSCAVCVGVLNLRWFIGSSMDRCHPSVLLSFGWFYDYLHGSEFYWWYGRLVRWVV